MINFWAKKQHITDYLSTLRPYKDPQEKSWWRPFWDIQSVSLKLFHWCQWVVWGRQQTSTQRRWETAAQTFAEVSHQHSNLDRWPSCPPLGEILMVWADCWQVLQDEAHQGFCRGCKFIVTNVMRNQARNHPRIVNMKCAFIHFKTHFLPILQHQLSLYVICTDSCWTKSAGRWRAPQICVQQDSLTDYCLRHPRAICVRFKRQSTIHK